MDGPNPLHFLCPNFNATGLNSTLMHAWRLSLLLQAF